jgi:Mannosylglycerate hydrolase MGH1-like glycoside hydrolase domain
MSLLLQAADCAHYSMPMFHSFLRNFAIVGILSVTCASFAQTRASLPTEWKVGIQDYPNSQNLTFDDSQWKTIDLANSSKRQNGDFHDVVWCRLHLKIPADLQGQDLFLHLGKMGNESATFFNGVRILVGFGDHQEPIYIIPAVLIKFGSDNVIAVKISNHSSDIVSGEFDWSVLSAAAKSMVAQGIKISSLLEETCKTATPGAAEFILQGVRSSDFKTMRMELESTPSSAVVWKIASRWNALCKIEKNLQRYLQEYELYKKGDLISFMKNQATYLVPDFQGDQPQRPVMGSSLSDFGSWYNLAYSGGINRFLIGSVRQNVAPNNEFFNTARDVGLLALFFKDETGNVIDGGNAKTSVTWYPYGWQTFTRHGNLEVKSAAFFTAFDTIVVYASVKNVGDQTTDVAPCLLVTARSEYGGKTGGQVTGSQNGGNIVTIRNIRVGPKTTPELYDDTLAIGSTLGTLAVNFVSSYASSARGEELKTLLKANSTSSLDSSSGSAILTAAATKLKPGESLKFDFIVAAAPQNKEADIQCESAVKEFAASPQSALEQADADWNGFFGNLPKLDRPSYDSMRLYYSAAMALRRNHYILEDKGRLYNASLPDRGGFNYFFQSDACWNLLGYLDFEPQWAEGHAVPIMDPPCEIMDPHFFWSMWELYSRLPDKKERQDFAAEIYPLLKNAYHVWTTKLNPSGNLLVSTPDNWDDNPRYDLIFKEIKYTPGWNSWWDDLVRDCVQNRLEDPAPSSQLGYGTVVMGRLAKVLGKHQEADYWARQFQRHCKAIDSLWNEKLGYWIVTYRGSETNDVLTSSIIYPIFTDLCRDPKKIKRVIEEHILNPAEFNGHFPIPTVAYNDPRYYHEKPPFENISPGGLWRGNIWMPETWIVVKGLYEYGYEKEANDIAGRLIEMMCNQSASVGDFQQFAFSPAEWYNSENGLAQNNRGFSWSSAVAMDFLLGNYQNERVVGTNSKRDQSIEGHVREIFDFDSGSCLFRVETTKSVFPVLKMKTADGLPINQSKKIEFSFSDPSGNFNNQSQISFAIDKAKWRVAIASPGRDLAEDNNGLYNISLGTKLILLPAK